MKNHSVHDIYTSMTSHEDEILLLFDPKEGDTVVDIGQHSVGIRYLHLRE